MTKRIIENLSVMILTFNEAPNIARTLGALRGFMNVFVIDSGSTDGTIDIVAKSPNAQILTRCFDSFAGQCNFGLNQIDSEWILSIDADYVLSDQLVREIRSLHDDPTINGYDVAFTYCIHGRPLRANLYPRRTVLYRRTQARYYNEGHGHRVVLTGSIGQLANYIYHDDRKPLNRWLNSQHVYAATEAEHLLNADPVTLSRVDRLRKLGWPAPILVFVYTLVVKRCILDGWHGWVYVLQRTLAEITICLALNDARLHRNEDPQERDIS